MLTSRKVTEVSRIRSSVFWSTEKGSLLTLIKWQSLEVKGTKELQNYSMRSSVFESTA